HPFTLLRCRQIAVLSLEPGQSLLRRLVVRVDRQHVLQCDLLISAVLHRTTEPEPGEFVLLVALDHLEQQPLPIGPPPGIYRCGPLVEQPRDLIAHVMCPYCPWSAMYSRKAWLIRSG